MVVIQLRWSDVGPEAYEEARRVLPDGAHLPAGCYSRALRRQGNALFDTEVWRSQDEARDFLLQLPEVMRPAGLAGPSHTVAFAVPDQFAVTYLRAGRQPGFLPAPRGVPGEELVSGSITTAALARP